MRFGIAEHDVIGTLDMNKLIMSEHFKLEAKVDLTQKLTTTEMVKIEGRKRPVEKTETKEVHAGSIIIEINLQSGDTEDELKRNFMLKTQKLEEERSKAEAEKSEMAKRKL